jgi:hypothetical protein
MNLISKFKLRQLACRAFRGEAYFLAQNFHKSSMILSMNITFKGKLFKSQNYWIVEVPDFQYRNQFQTPDECFRSVEEMLRMELKDPNLICHFKHCEELLYLSTALNPKVIEILGGKIEGMDNIRFDPALDDDDIQSA